MKHANFLKRFSRTSALVVALGILAYQWAPVEAVLRKDQRKAMNTYVLEQVKKVSGVLVKGCIWGGKRSATPCALGTCNL